MFDQFWQQYPQGSILSDLVQIHEDLYVVKVTLASGGQPLVATLAAADRLETAEAMARAQAMQILGCGETTEVLPAQAITVPEEPLEPMSLPETTPMQSAKAVQASSPEPQDRETAEIVEPITVNEPDELPLAPEAIDESASLPSADLSMASLSSNGSPPVPPEPIAALEVSEEAVVAAPAKTRSKKAAAPPVESTPEVTATDDAAPLSVTDIIPLINMELKRLNWSREQGRDYMVSLYNKRASSLLSDEELFGLLQHLRDEPDEG